MLQNPKSHLDWTNSPALNPLRSAMRSLRPSWLLRASGQVWCHGAKPGIQKHAHNPSLCLKAQHHPTVCSIQVLPALPHTFLLLNGNRELLWAGWSTATLTGKEQGQLCVSRNLTFNRSQCWRNLPRRTLDLPCRGADDASVSWVEKHKHCHLTGRLWEVYMELKLILIFSAVNFVCVPLIHASGTCRSLQQNLFCSTGT